MLYEKAEKDGVVVLSLKSSMMGGSDATKINEEIHQLVEQNKKQIVLNLKELEWINSSGLGILVGNLTTVKNSGGNLFLCNLSEKISNLLSITKLSAIFQCYESVDEAVQAFG